MLLTAGRALPHDHACLLLREAAGWRLIAGTTATSSSENLVSVPGKKFLAGLPNLICGKRYA